MYPVEPCTMAKGSNAARARFTSSLDLRARGPTSRTVRGRTGLRVQPPSVRVGGQAASTATSAGDGASLLEVKLAGKRTHGKQECAMRLTSVQVERTLNQFEAEAIPDDH